MSSIPAEQALKSLSDRRFVVGLTSLGLWIDATLAVAFGTNLLQMDIAWAKAIPVGKLLIILTGYGVALTLVLPPIVNVCNWAWWTIGDAAAEKWPRFRDSWHPERDRDVDAFALIAEAAHAGNSALVAYAQQHLDDFVHSYDNKHHLMLIGATFIAEVFAPASLVNHCVAVVPERWGVLVVAVTIVLAAISLSRGVKPLSLYATFLRRPDKVTR